MNKVKTENRIESSNIDKIHHAQTTYFIVILLSYFIADLILSLLVSIIPNLLSSIYVIFEQFTRLIFIVVLMLLASNFISLKIPELNIDVIPSKSIIVLPLLIFTHPIIIFFNGKSILVTFLLPAIISSGQIILFLIELLIYSLVSLRISKVLFLRKVEHGSQFMQRYKKISVEVLLLIALFSILIKLLSENILFNDTDGFEFTYFFKITLSLLMFFSLRSEPELEV